MRESWQHERALDSLLPPCSITWAKRIGLYAPSSLFFARFHSGETQSLPGGLRLPRCGPSSCVCPSLLGFMSGRQAAAGRRRQWHSDIVTQSAAPAPPLQQLTAGNNNNTRWRHAATASRTRALSRALSPATWLLIFLILLKMPPRKGHLWSVFCLFWTNFF